MRDSGIGRWLRPLVSILALSGRGSAAPVPDRPAVPPAEAAWERLKGLAGQWTGRSTKGWEEKLTWRLIAGGSVLLETSQFVDDPDGKNAMASSIARDGERILLTHYCEAGNQPRLVASGLRDPGNTILFTFLDGGNLPSRDRGHMDKLELRFEDADHFSSRWTWYENGRERWLEDIRYERTPSAN